MKLTELLSCIPQISQKIPSMEIEELTESSRKCHEKTLFVCIKGYRSDGHAYAKDAYQRGCRAFLAQKSLELPEDAFVFLVENTREALGVLACRFYGHPSHRIPVVGITGTKGKTTVACMLRGILEKNGISCGYIGTNGMDYSNVHIDTENTTPDAITLQKTLTAMISNGCKAVVMEVSSQALAQYRVAGMKFFCCVFTNLFTDHIGAGEHHDFEDYKACKKRLFTDFDAETVIYNISDPHGADVVSLASKARLVTCSTEEAADYSASALCPAQSDDALGMSFDLICQEKSVSFTIPLIGNGNALNAVLASAVARECFGISLQNAAKALNNARIPGRSEVIPLENGGIAVIDYAHNGESLRQLLEHLRRFHPRRLICLFGSVGDRTAIRRKELGRAAAEYSDLCILTSDNPGMEDPQKILDEIAEAVSAHQTPYRCFTDRAEAIRYAVGIMETGDILVLAGKGHEAYQLIGSQKIPFSEKDILLSASKAYQKESVV